MQNDRFVDPRRERWQELEKLAARARQAISKMSAAEVLRLGRLYRAAASDLALASKYIPNHRAVIYLEDLAKKTHSVVYQRSIGRAKLGEAIKGDFPAAYRKIGRYTAAAFGLFAAAALVSALAVAYHSANANLLLGSAEVQNLRSIMSHHRLWMGQNIVNQPVTANFIMLNNIQVAFLAFAGGVLLGIGTVYIVATNGIMLGAIAALVAQYGLSRQFWSFVFPHGVIELSVIFMAAGCGLALGDAILRPGLRRRGRSLADAARTVLPVIVGCIPVLMVAGTIESFFSPSSAPAWLKIATGLVAGALLYAYLLGYRGKPTQHDEFVGIETRMRAIIEAT